MKNEQLQRAQNELIAANCDFALLSSLSNVTYASGYEVPVAHYSGHQIGVAVNELPRLVPYDHTPVEVGMVFSVEPGAYEGSAGTFGARSEKMVLVTESGLGIICDFNWGIA